MLYTCRRLYIQSAIFYAFSFKYVLTVPVFHSTLYLFVLELFGLNAKSNFDSNYLPLRIKSLHVSNYDL